MRIGAQWLPGGWGRSTGRASAGWGDPRASAERGSPGPLLREAVEVAAMLREIRKRAQNHDWFINSGSWSTLCDAVADRRFLLDYIGQLERQGGMVVDGPTERAVLETRIHEHIQSLLDCAAEAAAGGLTLLAEAHEDQARALRALLDEEEDSGTADAAAGAGPAVLGPTGRSVRRSGGRGHTVTRSH